MITRRKFLTTAATASAAAAAGVRADALPQPAPPVASSKAPTGSPNVLIFLPDQQNGATVLPGSPVVKPNMDRFRKEAITFNSAHCPAPHCCPSRASFMSGRYPSETGIYNNVSTNTAIHPDPYPGTPFWGNALKDAGYQTGYAGKLHVGRHVKAETCGFKALSTLEQDNLEENEVAQAAQWKRARGENYSPAMRPPGQILRPDWGNFQFYNTTPDDTFQHNPDYKVVQAGIAGMKEMAATGQPWCVMISNSGAHDAYWAPKKFVDLYDPTKIELPASFEDTMDDKPRIYQRQRYEYWSQLSDEESKLALIHYYAKCSMQDELFGQMLKALDETGQADNTIVIYVSDHGDYHAAHGLWMKGVPSFREAYHIPCVIRWPKGAVSPGREVDAFVDQVDFAPTILEVCGVTSPAKLSGASLMPWLKGQTPATWRHATCTQMNGVELYYTQRIVMTKEYKYVYNGFDYDELYDLKNDPYEMHNLAFPDLPAKRAAVKAGKGLPKDGHVPWPPLSPALEQVRKDLLTEMWNFAADHHDIIFNPYRTVALAPFGPGLGEVEP
ncbi:MAG: sulfatase-like hydrolase/transferase [Acidobacteriaceae bacterium]|nr:sulfatase-like hydrolase/transferase [Acidobacteriaceae bacterium]